MSREYRLLVGQACLAGVLAALVYAAPTIVRVGWWAGDWWLRRLGW